MDAAQPAPNPERVQDPSSEICPDFSGPAYAAIRQRMVERAGMTEEEVTQALKDGWQAEHDQKVQRWEVQQQNALAAAEGARQRLQAEEDAQRAEEQRVLDEEKKALEKKKPKLARMVPNKRPAGLLHDRVSEYAREKLGKFGFIELDYFTAGAKKEATRYAKAVADDAVMLMRGEGESTINLVPAASGRAQKVRADKDLPFTEFLLAWQGFLAELETLPFWPELWIKQYAAFFFAIASHKDNQDPIGQAALMLYVDLVRHEWHRQAIAKSADDTVFDIGEFAPAEYDECRRVVQNKRGQEAIEVVSNGRA
ncbi:hypothetical protein FOMPIDRAFT_87541 [Fomitopsis schrenkii]|uniref:Uncharacterized protein n=1 Tax=Fomitopsis schrenkii TaxID=2126942 RepID=S8G155_FOMSC|nr:hypothetical protein FOMPIDRAFT_87541 [Fomitopsis schrenkii]